MDPQQAAREYLRARRLREVWDRSKRGGRLDDALVDRVIGKRELAAASRLFRMLSSLGEPIRLGRHTLRISTEHTSIETLTTPRRRRRRGRPPASA